MERLLYRPAEVAELLGIGRTRTYDLINAGVIPSIRVGRSRRVPSDTLKAWVAQQSDDTAREILEGRKAKV